MLKRLKIRRQKITNENLSNILPLAGDEGVKEGKGLKILTPNKLLTRLPNIISTKKSRKQFIQIQNQNQKNTFVSAQ